jgi:hypothetical protein
MNAALAFEQAVWRAGQFAHGDISRLPIEFALFQMPELPNVPQSLKGRWKGAPDRQLLNIMFFSEDTQRSALINWIWMVFGSAAIVCPVNSLGHRICQKQLY